MEVKRTGAVITEKKKEAKREYVNEIKRAAKKLIFINQLPEGDLVI